MQGMMTPREQTIARDDHGLTAALAVAHQLMARECHDLPENLIAAAANQYFFATTGTVEQRRAVVDAWAARHHVKAGLDDNLGYCARVRLGLSSMLAIAAPVLAEVTA